MEKLNGISYGLLACGVVFLLDGIFWPLMLSTNQQNPSKLYFYFKMFQFLIGAGVIFLGLASLASEPEQEPAAQEAAAGATAAKQPQRKARARAKK